MSELVGDMGKPVSPGRPIYLRVTSLESVYTTFLFQLSLLCTTLSCLTFPTFPDGDEIAVDGDKSCFDGDSDHNLAVFDIP